jgi:hypothetical protein
MHAIRRMVEMDVERAEVVECLNDPEFTRTCDPEPRRIAKRGRLSVVFDPATLRVVTVLWAEAGITTR